MTRVLQVVPHLLYTDAYLLNTDTYLLYTEDPKQSRNSAPAQFDTVGCTPAR